MNLLVRSWLYVPASSPRLLDKAMAGSADAVVYDLEDSVPAGSKNSARDNVLAAVAAEHEKPLWVRINDPASPAGIADVRALSGSSVDGVRIPKAEDPELVGDTAQRLGTRVHPLIESGLGLERAYELASCHPDVAVISLGEADLKADLRIRDDDALDWARQRVVTASRAAGLASPVHSVWTDVRDLDGLSRDTAKAADRGLFGRSVVHPSQVDVVNAAFTPDAVEVRASRDLVNSLRGSDSTRSGGWLDGDGRFVDEAVVAQARWVLELANALPTGTNTRGRA